MDQQRIDLIWAAMLHDAGKLCRRGGREEDHGRMGGELLRQSGASQRAAEAAERHHTARLEENPPEADHPAWILWAANRVAGGIEEEDTDPSAPLFSVFGRLGGEPEGMACPPGSARGLVLPRRAEDCRLEPGWYRERLERLRQGLAGLPAEEDFLDPLLELCEDLLSDIPAAGREGAEDISLYDHSRMTAALACCIQDWCREQAGSCRELLFEGEERFRAADAFLLCSCDFSGIQRFIYQVSSDGALRSLRARSFFLELLMEHLTDQLLGLCGLSRANLLYSGGGHCYLLLPNTDKIRRLLADWDRGIRRWLIRQFGAALYLAAAWLPCSADDLLDRPAEESPYSGLFRRLSEELGRKKLRRYSPEELLALSAREGEPGERECAICGRAVEKGGEEDLCFWCAALPRLSRRLMDPGCLAIVTGERPEGPALPLPGPAGEGEQWLSLGEIGEARALGKGCRRIYRKNTGAGDRPLPRSARIWLGDYVYSGLLEELSRSDEEEGIARVGILRMDVDGLGQAFISGFCREGAGEAAERERYVTLPRYITFSRQMSLFFKHHINGILAGEEEPARVLVVYSGGDDVFLAGYWRDIILAARRIRRIFSAFTLGRLSISGGIGLCPARYPIYLSAREAGALEEDAKELPGKDAVSLFQPGRHRYRWEVFEAKVLEEKLRLLRKFFDRTPERGGALRYQLLEYLEGTGERLNIARYAYLLARMRPQGGGAATRALYEEFSRQMYRWILSPEDRRQLITAVYLDIYQTRKSKGGAESGV